MPAFENLALAVADLPTRGEHTRVAEYVFAQLTDERRVALHADGNPNANLSMVVSAAKALIRRYDRGRVFDA